MTTRGGRSRYKPATFTRRATAEEARENGYDAQFGSGDAVGIVGFTAGAAGGGARSTGRRDHRWRAGRHYRRRGGPRGGRRFCRRRDRSCDRRHHRRRSGTARRRLLLVARRLLLPISERRLGADRAELLQLLRQPSFAFARVLVSR